MFQIAAKEIGEVVSGRKKLKALAKDVETKKVRKQLIVEKINPRVELEEPFLKKLVRKPVALTKNFFVKIN